MPEAAPWVYIIALCVITLVLVGYWLDDED